MITFRPIDIENDYPTLEAWWFGHNSLPVPKLFLPRGWIAESCGIKMAASFLYMDPKLIGVIEWTTTNPRCALSRDLVEAVRGLYSKLEEEAKASGCLAIISFVKPKSSEERIMAKMGFATSADDTGHRMFAKPLVQQNWNVPEGGEVKCP